MTLEEDVRTACASVAANILSIVLAVPGGLSPDGVVHIHEITPGFPIHEHLQSRQARGGEAIVQCVWHDHDNPLVPPDGYWPGHRTPDCHVGVVLLPWSNPEGIRQAGEQIADLGWSGCMDRVVVVASTSEAIHDLENYIWDNAEMVVLAPVMPSIVRADPFRFMAAVVNPFPVGH